MNRNKKIIIVGGGPAGAFCAYNLAKTGYQPIIFDDSHPREKPCGGGLSPHSQEKFSFLKDIPIPRGSGNKIEIISPNNKKIIVSGKKKCIAISRLQFDRHILKMAMNEGAKLIKEKVLDIKKNKNSWIIKTENRKMNADILIGADGANSLVRKKIIGPIKKEDLSLAFGYFVKGIENRLAMFKFLDDKNGYIWAFPRSDHTSLGIGIELNKSQGIEKDLDSFIEQYYPNIKKKSKWAALIPTIKNLKTYKIPVAGNNWILIGDAASHVDPITGEGIIYALWSGELAAKAIVEDNPKKFNELWKKEYGEQLIMGSKLKNIFYNKYFLEILIKIASKSKTCSEFLYDTMTGSEMYKGIFFKFTIKFPRILLEYFNLL
jgi:geranylgeranyl reductase family protein